jgi:hypothetical protein
MVPSKRVVANFTDCCGEYFQRTVFSEECSSWYKTGGSKGRVSALWPGSRLHAVEVLKTPRFEDFEFIYIDGNNFAWFGDGSSLRDSKTEPDKAHYLKAVENVIG